MHHYYSNYNHYQDRLLISIITVIYNNKNDLKKTIQSVIKQSYNNIEYIIIDGGSNDGTVEIIKEYSKKITFWISEPDDGLYDAMNKGIDYAHGDYIYFLNAGDTFANNNVIGQVINILDKSQDVNLLYGNIRLKKNNKLIEILKYENVSKFFLLRRTICHQAIFVQKNVFNLIGRFNTQYKIKADYDWILRCFFNSEVVFKYVDIDIANFELGGISDNKLLDKKERIEITNKYFNIAYKFLLRLIYIKIYLKDIFINSSKKRDDFYLSGI